MVWDWEGPVSTVEARRQILAEAAEIVAADRNTSYGEPEDTFARIANLWTAYLHTNLNRPITRADVANLMMLMKVARLATNPSHRDSWMDAAGYAACGWSCAVDGMTTEPPPK